MWTSGTSIMATKPRIARDHAVRHDRKVRIFLSYKLEDEKRANLLETALRSAGEGRIDVFRARKIPLGTDWHKSICQNIANSDILLLLYTDDSRNWMWCLFECGMFLRSVKKIENPLICLHHPEAKLPDPLSHLKSFPGTRENARELLKYILHVYPHKRGLPLINPDLFEPDEAHRQLLDLCCNQIMMAIGEKAEQHYVHEAWMKTTTRLDGVIEHKDDRGRNTYDLRPDVEVEVSPQLSAILGLHQTRLSWGKLSKVSTSTVNDDRWLPALCRIIFEFMQPNGTCANGRSMLQMFRSNIDRRLYRPYVHQADRHADGGCCFHVHFMEESCLDYQTLSPQLGRLFTGMTMGVRFRHELLNQYRGKLDDLVLTRESCRAVIKEIWHTIEQIEQEGNARGINDPSRFPIAFGQYRDEVRGMFDRWYRTREQLVQVCSDCECCEQDTRDQRGRCDRLNTMDRLLDELWDMNRRFLFLASARIHEVVAAEV